MPIPVTCRCGQQVQAPDNLAGRTVACPRCKGPLVIPGGGDDLFADIGLSGAPKCPGCRADIQPGAVLCVKCGLHFESGEKYGGGSKPKKAGHGADADWLLEKAERELEDTPANADEGTGPKYMEYVMTILLIVIAAGLVAGAVWGTGKIREYQERRAAEREQGV